MEFKNHVHPLRRLRVGKFEGIFRNNPRDFALGVGRLGILSGPTVHIVLSFINVSNSSSNGGYSASSCLIQLFSRSSLLVASIVVSVNIVILFSTLVLSTLTMCAFLHHFIKMVQLLYKLINNSLLFLHRHY